MEIRFVSKKRLYPYFGYAIPKLQRAYVREDLPGCVREYVAAHERYHLSDLTENRLFRELRASFLVDWRNGLGFLVCAILSVFTRPRWALGCRRVRKGN